jgi:prepilin-type processing-associated H-X9-DG protein
MIRKSDNGGDLSLFRSWFSEDRSYQYYHARGTNVQNGRYASGYTHKMKGPNILWIDGHISWMHLVDLTIGTDAQKQYWSWKKDSTTQPSF